MTAALLRVPATKTTRTSRCLTTRKRPKTKTARLKTMKQLLYEFHANKLLPGQADVLALQQQPRAHFDTSKIVTV